MNVVVLTGRLTRDAEVRYNNNNMAIARFTVAVDRARKVDGQPNADFPSCVAFGKTAEFIEKWFRKGMKIEIEGRLQTGSYTNKDNQKVYTTDIVVDKAGFAESKQSTQNSENVANTPQQAEAVFMDVPTSEVDNVPFV